MADVSAIVILNCISGKNRKSDIPKYLGSLATALGVKCEIISVRTSLQVMEAARQAARSRHQVVIVGGGDGTINAVASQLAGTDKRLGVLPLGTFNYFAREIELPTDLDSAFRTCFDGETRTVTVGEVNGQVFLNNASIGLYPMILAGREQNYRHWGRARIIAYWSVVTALLRFRLNMKLTITANGERRTVRTPLLFAARNVTQLEEYRVPGSQCVAEGGFSVYTLRARGILALLRVVWRAFVGKLTPNSDFDMICTNEMRVESRRSRLTLAFDGERVKMQAPLEFRIREAALTVLVPKKQEQAA